MKNNCIKCNSSLYKNIDKNFESYLVGRIKCPKCGEEQERYISYFDLSLFFALNTFLYMLAALLMIYLINCFGFNLIIIVVLILSFIALYLLLKLILRYIYKNAPFKKNWKNNIISEDTNKIQKSIKTEYTAFLAIVLLFGTGNSEIWIYILFSLSFTIIISIKTYLIYKNEKTSIE